MVVGIDETCVGDVYRVIVRRDKVFFEKDNEATSRIVDVGRDIDSRLVAIKLDVLKSLVQVVQRYVMGERVHSELDSHETVECVILG